MNQTELAQIRIMIGEAMDVAVKRVAVELVQPIRDDLDALILEAKGLEADTRKHSGEHRDLVRNVDKTSQNDVKQDAAIAQILVKLEAVEKAQKAEKGEREVTAAMTQDLYDGSKKFLARHPALGNAIVGLVVAVINTIALLLTVWAASRGH